MKVLLTGGCGYIGVHLARKLCVAGYSVVVLDKCLFPSGEQYLQAWANMDEMDLLVIRDDVRTVNSKLFLHGFDAVCHLAGLSNDPTANKYPEANFAINYEGTVRLATLAKAAGVNRFTFASSASVYGGSDTKGLLETAPLKPVGHYGEAKAKAEDALLRLAGNGFEPVILRQATVSGWSPRMRWDLVVNTFVRLALKHGLIRVHAGGEALRPLIDVQDVAEAHVRFLEAEGVGGQVYNVAKRRQPKGDCVPLSEGYTIACLALYVQHLLKQMGTECRVVGDWSRGEGRSYDIDCSKMRETLGWEPQRGVMTMVSDLLENFGAEEMTGVDDAETNNIGWMDALVYGESLANEFGGVF
jgi:nucleoside-diphosphate-sugar epimerase